MQMTSSFAVRGNTGGGPSLERREEIICLVLNLLCFEMAEGHPNGENE